MTAEELIEIRKHWGLSQTTMANQIGLALRAYQDIENKRSALRPLHVLAIERVSLARAALLGDKSLMLDSVRTDISLLPPPKTAA